MLSSFLIVNLQCVVIDVMISHILGVFACAKLSVVLFYILLIAVVTVVLYFSLVE